MFATDGGLCRHTLQFIDISAKIFYDDIKAQEEFMSLSTSTISHEMRNPLNSIISQCKIQEENINELDSIIKSIKHKLTKTELESLQRIKKDMQYSNQIQITSSKLLQFNVEDILGIAQIKAGKFTKKNNKFNIKKAIEEVIQV